MSALPKARRDSLTPAQKRRYKASRAEPKVIVLRVEIPVAYFWRFVRAAKREGLELKAFVRAAAADRSR